MVIQLLMLMVMYLLIGKNVNLGSNATKKLINNLPICPVTRGPHCIGNTNVYV
jgi:hypothetical protein